MGRFNKYSGGVGARRRPEKKYLLGAERPSFPRGTACKLPKPSTFYVPDGETAHSPGDLNEVG